MIKVDFFWGRSKIVGGGDTIKKSTIILFVFVFIFTFGYQGLVQGKNTPQEEKNLNIVKRFFNEVLNKGNTNLIDEFAAANCQNYRNGVLFEKVGPDVLKENIKKAATRYLLPVFTRPPASRRQKNENE